MPARKPRVTQRIRGVNPELLILVGLCLLNQEFGAARRRVGLALQQAQAINNATPALPSTLVLPK